MPAEDLIARAAGLGPAAASRLAWRLRDRGPCPMCDVGLDRHSPDTARPELDARGRDPEAFRAFAAATRAGRQWARCRVRGGDTRVARSSGATAGAIRQWIGAR